MPSKNVLDEVLSSRFLATDRDAVATRRAPLIAGLPLTGTSPFRRCAAALRSRRRT
jgi:hypothetical protein